MKNEIKALFFNYSQANIDIISDELINFDYVLHYKIIENLLSLDTEINNANWDIIVTKKEEANNIIDVISDTGKNTYVVIVSENRDSEFIKSVFRKGRCDVVINPGTHDMPLALIRNYEGSKSVKNNHNSDRLLQEAEEKAEKLLNDLIAKRLELEDVVYITSHDIRSPVVNVLGFSDEMTKVLDKLSAKIFDEANMVQNKEEIDFLLNKDIPQIQNFIKLSGEKIEKMLLGLLKLSRLGRSDLSNVIIDMNKLLQNVVSGFEIITQHGNIQINVGELPDCFADETMINQVFTCLIDNAVKYRNKDKNTVINISAKQNKNNICYCVSDNGIGISESDVGKVFDVFYRVNPENSQGDGIGLSLVKKAIERVEGEISVESKLENHKEGIEGETSFYITVKKQAE